MLDCGHDPSPHADFTTRFGVDSEGRKHCYECCANFDREQMSKDGRATLYLTVPDEFTGYSRAVGRAGGWQAIPSYLPSEPVYYVSNWPGSLKYPAFVRKGRHNLAGTRYDVWFTDFQGRKWHGVQYGENSQLCHCRRLSDVLEETARRD